MLGAFKPERTSRMRSFVLGGSHVIRQEAVFFCRTSSSIRLGREFKESKVPEAGLQSEKKQGVSFLRKGEVLAYVGRIHNLKDLKARGTFFL